MFKLEFQKAIEVHVTLGIQQHAAARTRGATQGIGCQEKSLKNQRKARQLASKIKFTNIEEYFTSPRHTNRPSQLWPAILLAALCRAVLKDFGIFAVGFLNEKASSLSHLHMGSSQGIKFPLI